MLLCSGIDTGKQTCWITWTHGRSGLFGEVLILFSVEAEPDNIPTSSVGFFLTKPAPPFIISTFFFVGVWHTTGTQGFLLALSSVFTPEGARGPCGVRNETWVATSVLSLWLHILTLSSLVWDDTVVLVCVSLTITVLNLFCLPLFGPPGSVIQSMGWGVHEK